MMGAQEDAERGALKAIYQSLGGSEWRSRANWLSDSEPVSTWSGIRCNADGKVTALELSQNNLQGRLDDAEVVSALQVLGSLEQLWLSENNLHGNLPLCLASADVFPHLSIVDVGSNKLRGTLALGFTRDATRFSWFDTSGNELTSYYRYDTVDSIADAEKDFAETLMATRTTPTTNVHVVPSLLTEQQGATLIDLAICYAKADTNGGWQTDRHKAYKTTDIDIGACGGELLHICNELVRTRFAPLLSRLFGFPVPDLAIEDLFLAKYSAAKGEQNALAQHRDGSELSFVITLNDPATAFRGGGTKFETLTVAPDSPGTGVFFCGRQLHSGVEVKEGIRYILAGFVRVFPSTVEQEQRLSCLLDQYPTT